MKMKSARGTVKKAVSRALLSARIQKTGKGAPEEMAAHTWNNGLRLFGLEGKV